MLDRRWAVEKRHELVIVIIYSVVGLAIATALVTYLNYALFSGSAAK
ncbi:MAG: hypothetical protein ABSE45_06550 [Candidatus Acidiferrales bacterium]|jgi:hypothetical protein